MRILVSFATVLALAAPAWAQDTFKQVWVTQADSGEIVRGRIVQLSGESIAILTPDNRRVDLPLDRVLRIEAHGDSLKNGALIGAGVMAGLMVLGCQGLDRGSQCFGATVFNVGFGALVGMGIDALNGGRSVLYARPAAGKQVRVGFKLKF